MFNRCSLGQKNRYSKIYKFFFLEIRAKVVRVGEDIVNGVVNVVKVDIVIIKASIDIVKVGVVIVGVYVDIIGAAGIVIKLIPFTGINVIKLGVVIAKSIVVGEKSESRKKCQSMQIYPTRLR